MKKSIKNKSGYIGGSGKTRKNKEEIFRISPSNPELQNITLEDIDGVIDKEIDNSIKISKQTREYLVTIMNKKTPDDIRRINSIEDDNIAGFTLKKSTTNKQMLIQIVTEIINLSYNNIISKKKPLKTIKINIINEILDKPDNEYIKRLVI
jgi:hypothetical protein